MNIGKQREIMRLKEEAFHLSKEYQEKKEEALEKNTPPMLDAAIEKFVSYLEGEGFTISRDKNSQLTAKSEDGIVISLDRKKTIFSVHMPNGERYNVMVKGTLREVETPKEEYGKSQDYQIQHYQKSINESKKLLDSVRLAEYRYILHTESYSTYTQEITYENKPFKNFDEILDVMFS
jgi:hypothetical protein